MKLTPKSMDDLTPEQVERCCPACRIRFVYPHPAGNPYFGPWNIDISAYRWLVNAARVFDAESDELFSASEFTAWLKQEIVGYQPIRTDHDGAPPRNVDGSVAVKGRAQNLHRHPDPLPLGGLSGSIRRVAS